jgi:hypothetical protein
MLIKRLTALLGIMLWLAGAAGAAAPEPLLIVQYREDQQSGEQERELTRVLDLSLRVRLKPTSNPDIWQVAGVEQDEAQGRQIFVRTSGSEIYVLEKVVPLTPDGRVTVWRDASSSKVLAVILPSIAVNLMWQSSEGAEPPEPLVVGPVSQRAGRFQNGKVPDPSERPALPDARELPDWLRKKGVHPDHAVDSSPEEDVYAGGGVWLREEPNNITEITYLWEFDLKP